MNENPFFVGMMILLGGYVTKLWIADLRSHREGRPNPNALPGATPAPRRAYLWGIAGALIILLAETWGEGVLGLTAEQSEITVLFGVYTLIAAVIEEIIFRGYIVVEGRGPVARWAGVVAASLLFALIHPFLWEWEEAGLQLTLTVKGWFSTSVAFITSLWFYTVRFASWNPERSLLPCFAAHAAKNLGVFAIKAAQGFVVGPW